DERVAGPYQVLDVLVDPPQLRLARDLLGHFPGLAGEGHRRGGDGHGGGFLGAERVGLDRSHGDANGSMRGRDRSNGPSACRARLPPPGTCATVGRWSSPHTRTRWRCRGCAIMAASTGTASRTARWGPSTPAAATGSRWWWRSATCSSRT